MTPRCRMSVTKHRRLGYKMVKTFEGRAWCYIANIKKIRVYMLKCKYYLYFKTFFILVVKCYEPYKFGFPGKIYLYLVLPTLRKMLHVIGPRFSENISIKISES